MWFFMIQCNSGKLSLKNSKTFKSIRYLYTALILVGGSVLGFFSLGLLGLCLGFLIGGIMSIILHKTFVYLDN